MANTWSLLNRYAGELDLASLEKEAQAQQSTLDSMGQAEATPIPMQASLSGMPAPVPELPSLPPVTPPPMAQAPEAAMEELPLDFEPELNTLQQPSYKPLRLPSQEDFDRAEKSSRDANLLVSLNQAFSMIPASITGKQLPESLIASQRAMANRPLEKLVQLPKLSMDGMSANLEVEMNDPQSDISELTREFATDILAKMQGAKEPAQIQSIRDKIADMSAAQFERVGIKLPSSATIGQRGIQQTPYVNKLTGNAVAIINNSYVDALTGEPVESGNLQNRTVNVVTDPKTGNILGLGTAGKVQQQISSVVEPKSSKDLERSFKGPNKTQRAAIDEEIGRFAKISETATKQLSAARNLKQLLAADTKLELGAVRTQMARISGEVGNLAAQEQEIWSGSQALLDRASQFLTSLKEGKLTSDNKKEIMKAVNAFQLAAEKALLRNKSEVLSRLELQNIPKTYSEKFIPTIGVEQRVRIKNTKTGQIFQVPASKAKKFLDNHDEYQPAD